MHGVSARVLPFVVHRVSHSQLRDYGHHRHHIISIMIIIIRHGGGAGLLPLLVHGVPQLRGPATDGLPAQHGNIVFLIITKIVVIIMIIITILMTRCLLVRW